MKGSEQNTAEGGSFLQRWGYALLMGGLRVLSHCPMRVLYVLSDVLYPLLRYVIRYRVKVVRRNLAHSFPEKTPRELRCIENNFYRYFCDLAVEIVKGVTIGGDELKRRVTVTGLDRIEDTFTQHDFSVCYLGHFGNWEWLTVLPLYLKRGGMTQIYHPMRNKTFDAWFCNNRSRFGAINIPMKHTLRRLAQLRTEMHEPDATYSGYLLGCIADQLPKEINVHHYTTFMNQRSAVFTGSEKIGRMMNSSFCYVSMTRLRRGYYHVDFQPLDASLYDAETFGLTDEFMRRLEQDIRRQPELWLWTHKRWKR